MNLSDRGELVGFLRKHGLAADKSLGQHFLADPIVISAIVAAAGEYKSFLEVGPGPGIITSFLCKKAEGIAVEFDPRMVRLLTDSSPNCKVVVADALKVNLAELLTSLPEPRALVSNMPYYITGPLLERFSGVRQHYTRAVLMMQKEVGEKILAQPGNRTRGSLSVNLQSQFNISHVVDAPGSCFLPPPKVDSVVLLFEPRLDTFPTLFPKVVKAGCSQPRKTLINNLGATFRLPRAEVAAVTNACSLSELARGCDLTEAHWIELATQAEVAGWK
ncbi:MAG TPA: 16S rRNA (adenine(1518)-N(6)/adenine(1519)-N(6))-dimethyltransferase RsmA [Fimbriimonas sp.]|nr:16S rRNA (adenine(1518)-N(6)/adenine(1519)-N(6))-dimethyltransferase RsmA [Fimbriimonas sp.]